jgi:DNA-binding FadR family transcriptional regulator
VIRQRYEQIADHLVEDVRAGRLRPGDRLPGERELAGQLGVGRASVREALGFLQVRGIIETRRGSGSFVAPEATAIVVEAAALTGRVPSADSSPMALLEAREALEPAIARLAAQAGDVGPELDALLELMDASSDPEDPAQRRVWSDADRDFHREVAVATRNPILAAVGLHVAEIMDQPLWQRLRDDAIAIPGRTALQLAEHRLIAATIAEGDADAAEALARRHVTRTRHYMNLD